MPPKPAHEVHGTDSTVAITIDYDKCMGCGMCAKVCNDTQSIGALAKADPKMPPNVIARNGDNSANTTTTRVALDLTNCCGCGQCTNACSFGAITPTSRVDEIAKAKAAGKKLVAVFAPATRVGISEAMGMAPGTSGEAQLIAALRQIGFDYVFDNLWGADACTIEDTKEVLHMRAHKSGPCYTSCCPAWINLVELRYPELIPKISTARSPNGMICSTIKKHWVKDMNIKAEDVFVVGFMPCTAKKLEAARPQLTTDGKADCDVSVTTKEAAALLKANNITFSADKEAELKAKPEGKFDAPFGEFSGSAYIFGKTSGVTESVARYVFALNKEPFTAAAIKVETVWEHADKIQNIKTLEFTCKGETYRAAVAHGGTAVAKCVEMEKELNVDVVEIMMCPMGCQNGGGQPKQMKKDLIPKRAEGLDKHDQECKYADCESNQPMHEYINKHMPTEHDIHEAFHTFYENRK
ncbi:FeFe-hydrogenase_1 [Hexamita inflata]|uniref:FeFe-hydrogenase 1 n=1 Tax=Hexamita inflata TaxID=28002 RepID=A0AA86R6C1_9EUKA|nr:FeFe-hydrogenase 1 [Hexamita inflata]